jgi:protease II
VAKLRDVKTDNNMLLFQCNMGAGHFRVTGRCDHDSRCIRNLFLNVLRCYIDTLAEPWVQAGQC